MLDKSIKFWQTFVNYILCELTHDHIVEKSMLCTIVLFKFDTYKAPK